MISIIGMPKNFLGDFMARMVKTVLDRAVILELDECFPSPSVSGCLFLPGQAIHGNGNNC